MAAMADNTAHEADQVAHRIAKRQRWLEQIHQSEKYKTVHAMISAGKPLPEQLPDTPRHGMAQSKRHWESLCKRYRHCLQRLFDYIQADSEMRTMIIDDSSQDHGESRPPATGDTFLACLQS